MRPQKPVRDSFVRLLPLVSVGGAPSGGGGRTLAQLQAICKYHGWNDTTATGLAQLTQFINDTLQLLATLAEWPEYIGRNGSVTFPARAATISACSAAGGTVTITTSAAHGFAAGNVVTISGTDNYDESSVTIASVPISTTFTVTSSSTGATSTGTATLDNNVETLSDTRINRMGIVVRTDRAPPLDEITLDEWLSKKKYHGATGPPTEYALRKSLSSGAPSIEMMVYPDPTTAITLYYTYRTYPLILANGTDVSEWPDTRVWLLTDALRTRLAEGDRDSGGAALYGADFMKKVNRAFAHARSSFMPIIAKPTYAYNGRPQWKLRDYEVNIVL